MDNTRTLPPAGWYAEPSYGVGQRYWDGQQWTEHVYVSGQQYTSPIATESPKKKIYWSNLFRFRTWWFSFTTALLVLFLFSVIGIPGAFWTPAFLITFAGMAWFWIHQQMACGNCGTVLRVTRLTGGQKVCHKCGSPTD